MNAELELEEGFSAEDLRECWSVLYEDERLEAFHALPHAHAEDFFLALTGGDQAALIRALPAVERRGWIRLLPPDDAADVIQQSDRDDRDALVGLLDEGTRREVTALLAYAEDEAGGLMNPRFARVRPEMTVDEAISYLRRQTRERMEFIYYAYVLDQSQKLLGVVSFRELFAAPGGKLLREVMHADPIAVHEETDQEALAKTFAQNDLNALPVVDSEGRMKGIITADDIVDVVQEESTEDIQKLGAVSALDAPYLQLGFVEMLKKRSGWMVALFVGQTLTVTVMSRYQEQGAKLLGLFVPLIISSGGNSGSQASTLVVRAIALGEVKGRDWWRVCSRELLMGLSLGLLLGLLGLLRIAFWPGRTDTYGEHWILLGTTVAFSLIGVVVWGTISGSMLPFLLRRVGLDPASASAPLVATLCDVTGLVIYFSVAALLLVGVAL